MGKEKGTRKRPVKTAGPEVDRPFTFIVLNHNTKKFEHAHNATEAAIHIERMVSQSDTQEDIEAYLDKIIVHQVTVDNEIDFNIDFTVSPDITVKEKEDL